MTKREKIERALERGTPACRVAKTLGVTRQYVHRIDKERGQERRPVGRPRKLSDAEAIARFIESAEEAYGCRWSSIEPSDLVADIRAGRWEDYR